MKNKIFINYENFGQGLDNKNMASWTLNVNTTNYGSHQHVYKSQGFSTQMKINFHVLEYRVGQVPLLKLQLSMSPTYLISLGMCHPDPLHLSVWIIMGSCLAEPDPHTPMQTICPCPCKTSMCMYAHSPTHKPPRPALGKRKLNFLSLLTKLSHFILLPMQCRHLGSMPVTSP